MTVHQLSGPSSFFGRKFLLIERIGSGTRGDVFLAEQESPGGFRRRVALKVLRTNLPPVEANEAAREIREEARLLGRLNHRSIVQVIDLVLLGGNWAVVLEPVSGPDLERVVAALATEQRRLPARAAFEVVASIADALNAAWTAEDGQGGALHLTHGEIDPSNVLLTRDGDVKVLGFGNPRMGFEREKKVLSRYMAPERIAGPSKTPDGDVYSLGVVLAELLLGAPLPMNTADPGRHAELVERVVGGVARRLRGDPPTIDEAEGLLRSTLARDPLLRPSARVVGDICASIAPRLASESLRPFARIFVPRVDGLLGRTAMLTSRTLSESTMTIDPLPARIPRPSARRSGWRVGLIATSLIMVIGAATLAFGATLVAMNLWVLEPTRRETGPVPPAPAPSEPVETASNAPVDPLAPEPERTEPAPLSP